MGTAFTDWDILRNLLYAARWTLLLSVVAFVGGGIVGTIVMLMRVSVNPLLNRPAWAFIELFQGTPLLMQLFIIFFAFPLFGVSVPAWIAASVSLTLWTAAFLAEIWRGCVEAIPRGQWEASRSLAMGYMQLMRHVILPQAVKIAIPPTVGFSVQVVKGTALTSLIGFIELLKAGTMIANATFDGFKVYGFVALLYFVICWPLSLAARALERKLNAPHRNH